MADPVIPSSLLRAVFDSLVLFASDSITVRLFTNDIDPDKDTVDSDFIEAAYDTYSEATVTVAPALADGNQWHFTPGHATFAAPTTGSTVDLFGVYVEYTPPSGVDPLLFSLRFDDAPLTFSPGDLPLAVFLDLQDLDTAHP